MSDFNLNTWWLVRLINAHHDGTTQQIDDFVQGYQTENARFLEKASTLHQTRLNEDRVWLTSQRDPVVKRLEEADKKQDGYISCTRSINQGHSWLPDGEPTQQEAKEVEQIFVDFKFRTNESYGAESDKIIQMQQNLASHQAFLTQIGAWPFFLKAVEQAQLVRQLLGERAMTLGEFVKGEMKAARQATDAAIADLYKTIEAMNDLMPSTELTALITQLKGIELYACRYYLNITPSDSGSNENGGGTEQGGTTDSGNSGTTEPGGTGTITPGGSNENDNENENGGTGSVDDNGGGGNGGSGMDQN